MAPSNSYSSRSSWVVLGALAVGAFSIEMGCKGDTKDDEQNLSEEARDVIQGMLEDVWPLVVEPQLNAAAEAASALSDASDAWLAAEEAGTDFEAAQTSAQTAWVEAMTRWQQVEVMQLGPAGSSLKVTGGADIRDEIYSWPVTNECKVDQVTAKLQWTEDGFIDEALVNSKGLDALEVLLFSPRGENSCPTMVSINRDGVWDDLGVDGSAASRAGYAVLLADRVESDIERIRSGWEDGFANDLATAGEPTSSFETELLGVNAIFDALFYLETVVKDRKLGWPLGLTDCGQEDCSGEVESTIAGGSNDWLAANLTGFELLFTGGDEGLGMDDLLDSVGQAELAETVLTNVGTSLASAEGMTGGVGEVSSEELTGVHADLKGVTDLLKSDIATVLTLQVPSEAAGDND